MTDTTSGPISVSRRIEAPAATIFGLLADPTCHSGLDGSGMVQDAGAADPIDGVGDVFTVRMHNPEMGDYEITNHVVDFQPNRRIAWEPVLHTASRPEDQDGIGERNGHRWSYDLSPDGPDATLVTETYDCTRSPDWLRNAVKGGRRWVESMTESLERLDRRSRGA